MRHSESRLEYVCFILLVFEAYSAWPNNQQSDEVEGFKDRGFAKKTKHCIVYSNQRSSEIYSGL